VIDRFNETAPDRARLGPNWSVDQPAGVAPAVGLDTPEHTRDVVLRALADADELIRTWGDERRGPDPHWLHGHVLAPGGTVIEADRRNEMNRALSCSGESTCLAASGRARRHHQVSGDSDVLDSLNRSETTRASRTQRGLLDEPRPLAIKPHARCSHSSSEARRYELNRIADQACDCRPRTDAGCGYSQRFSDRQVTVRSKP